MVWTLTDFTDGKKKGYLQLNQHGIRVCDFFPYAHADGTDADLIRAQAKYILDLLNNGVAAETARCVEIAESLEQPNVAAAIQLGAFVLPVKVLKQTPGA